MMAVICFLHVGVTVPILGAENTRVPIRVVVTAAAEVGSGSHFRKWLQLQQPCLQQLSHVTTDGWRRDIRQNAIRRLDRLFRHGINDLVEFFAGWHIRIVMRAGYALARVKDYSHRSNT